MDIRNKELVVKGIGKISTSPDIIVIEMTLNVVDLEYNQTMQRSTKLIDRLRNAVQTAGHDGKSLKTTNFNIGTEYDRYQDKNVWKNRFVGYACNHDLRLEFDLYMEILGETLSAIVGSDAKPKLKIRFSIKDPTAVSEELLKNAIENAKWKAGVLAKSAGVTLGDIQRIDYNWSDIRFYSDTMYDMKEAVFENALSVPMSMDIEPENIDVKDTATVVWSIQ